MPSRTLKRSAALATSLTSRQQWRRRAGQKHAFGKSWVKTGCECLQRSGTFETGKIFHVGTPFGFRRAARARRDRPYGTKMGAMACGQPVAS